MADIIVGEGPAHLTTEEKEAVQYLQYDNDTGRIKSSRPLETTLNSLYLGAHHKMSSGGENIFFTNLGSDIDWYPMWGGIKDQSVVANQGYSGTIKPSARVYSDVLQNIETVGAVAAAGSIAYGVIFRPTVNESLYGVTVRTAMAITTGDHIEFRIFDGNSNQGSLVYEQHFTAPQNYAVGDLVQLFASHPNETHSGTERYAEMAVRPGGESGDSTPFLVRPNNVGTLPWTTIHIRTYEDKQIPLGVVFPSNGDAVLQLGEPTDLVVDSSAAPTILFVPFTERSSFTVRDATVNMSENPTLIRFRNAADTATLYTVVLNKTGEVYNFFYVNDSWQYGEQGNSRAIAVSTDHTAMVDFPATTQPTIGRLEFDDTLTSVETNGVVEPVFVSTNDTTGAAIAGNSWSTPGVTSGVIAIDMGQLRNIDKLHIWNYHNDGNNTDLSVDQYRIWGYTDAGDASIAPPTVSGVDQTANPEYTLIAQGNLAQIGVALLHEQVNSLDTAATFRWLVIDCLTSHGTALGLRKVELYSLSQANFGFAMQTEVLSKTNTVTFVPSQDYHPATKLYVDNSSPGADGYISNVDIVDPNVGVALEVYGPAPLANNVLSSVNVDNSNIRVTVQWAIDNSRAIPTVNGNAVGSITQVVGNIYTGWVDMVLGGAEDALDMAVDGKIIHSPVLSQSARPIITPVTFVRNDSYPGAQTVYNAGDVISFTLATDIPVDTIRVIGTAAATLAVTQDVDVSAQGAGPYTFDIPVSAGVQIAGNVTVSAVAGTAVSDQVICTSAARDKDDRVPTIGANPTAEIFQNGAAAAGVRAVRGTTGTNAQRYYQPSYNFGFCSSWEVSVATEANAVDGVALNFRALNTQIGMADAAVTNTQLDLGSTASVNNTTTDNITLILRRVANDTFSVVTIQVPQQDAATTVTMVINGGNDLRSDVVPGATYPIVITAPDLLANVAIVTTTTDIGNLVRVGGLGVANNWTLQVSDVMAPGAILLANFNILNAAGIVSPLAGGGTASIRGFVIRNVVIGAFGNVGSTAVFATTEANIRVTWRGVAMTYSATDVVLFQGFFVSSMGNPVTFKLLDDAATGASSEATTATIEEIL